LEGEFVRNKNKLWRTAHMGEIRSACKIFVRKPDSESLKVGGGGGGCINMDLKEIG
jgi:hypothetical protein